VDAFDPAVFARSARMSRLFSSPSGKALIVAWAHAPLLGPIDGLTTADVRANAQDFTAADGLLVSPAMLPEFAPILSRPARPSVFILAQWQSVSRPLELLGFEEGATANMFEVEDAARAGADGVMSYLYVGWTDPGVEAVQVEAVAETSRRCRRLGLLHLVESRAVRNEFLPNGLARPNLVSYHTRLAAELGADLVKTRWTGPDYFPSVIDGCPVPVLVAGGARTGSLDENVAEASAILRSGAAGLVWGRRLFQADDPHVAVRRILDVVRSARER
jgi:DhnA family fructose-bisphosphate aldolase class Ia